MGKLAKELLKRRKQERASSPDVSQIEPEIIEDSENDKNGKTREGHNEEKEKVKAPKQEKVDDIKLAKELLKRRKQERASSPDVSQIEPEIIEDSESDKNGKTRNGHNEE